MTTGTAQSDVQPEAKKEPIAVLWVPDPETRRGWREWYIERPEKPNAKRAGFRR